MDRYSSIETETKGDTIIMEVVCPVARSFMCSFMCSCVEFLSFRVLTGTLSHTYHMIFLTSAGVLTCCCFAALLDEYKVIVHQGIHTGLVPCRPLGALHCHCCSCAQLCSCLLPPPAVTAAPCASLRGCCTSAFNCFMGGRGVQPALTRHQICGLIWGNLF